MPIILPDDKESGRSWNPIDTFWKFLSPALNPRPDASPAKLTPPAPIWDLPSPYGGVHHPETKDNIPYFVQPDYYAKLTQSPTHQVVHSSPPFWMVVSNFGWTDLAKAPFYTATAPAFSWAHYHFRKAATPTPYVWFASVVIGLGTAFVCTYVDSENRLQGYLPNEQDVPYWKERLEYQRKVASGEIDPRKSESMLQQSVYALLGPKQFDLQDLENEYLGASK